MDIFDVAYLLAFRGLMRTWQVGFLLLFTDITTNKVNWAMLAHHVCFYTAVNGVVGLVVSMCG